MPRPQCLGLVDGEFAVGGADHDPGALNDAMLDVDDLLDPHTSPAAAPSGGLDDEGVLLRSYVSVR
jgi:hypothetical protein